MSVATFEGIVENGQIRLKGNVRLPDGARVYVLVPEVSARPVTRTDAPRLADPQQAADFRMEVIEEAVDDGV